MAMGAPGVWLRLIATVAFLVAGCQKSDTTPDSASVVAAPPPVQTSEPQQIARDTASQCPHTGLWAPCSVERRLRQSGFVARKLDGETPTRPGFSVEPVAYSLGRSARLEIFLYKTAAELARDVAGLDTVRVVPLGSATSPWESTPTLIRSGNLAAVLLASSPVQAERLSLALTAGAPQPGSPR